ncbi:MAG: hypothetical protein HAW67_07630 [Endozoicomonadaceae bacterium]|nr:hypothetical protein [Endozoicomonadaceae bacterium]
MPNNSFNDTIDFLKNKHGEQKWTTVYETNSDDNQYLYCAFVAKEAIDKAMNNVNWDVMIGSGGPGIIESSEEVTYHTNINEPFLRLVLDRDFHGIKNSYLEILEEFRLFHNLYYEKDSNTYLDFDDVGDEIEVVQLRPNEVKIQTKYLRSFMAAKQINLLLYFDINFKHPDNYLDELKEVKKIKSKDLIFNIYPINIPSNPHAHTPSIMGKKLILCEPIEQCGVWPFDPEKIYHEFIFADTNGKEVTFSCNPKLLANYFGANPEAPHYLQPIFFRNEVLNKYYGNSGYELSDGMLRRKGSWLLRLDNHSSQYVSVFLGDLGTDLPEQEQLYWKSFNDTPDDAKISRTNSERSFLGNWFDSENPEHRFKSKYRELQKYWQEKYGWNLFLPFAKEDEHYFNSIRSPLTKEQSEFDSLIMAITKLIVDSINNTELRKHLSIADNEIKPIRLLETLLEKLKSENAMTLASILKRLQAIRSSGSAHRKGSTYDKEILKFNEAMDQSINKLSIDCGEYKTTFDKLLFSMIFLFDEITQLDAK